MSGIYPNVPSVLFSVVLTALIVISLQKPLLSQTPKDTFVDGKTIVTEIAFEGLDSDFEVSLPNLADPLRESTAREIFKTKGGPKVLNLTLDRFEVGKGIKALKKWLFGEGYVYADVIAYGEKMSPETMRIVYSIERKEATSVVEVRFEGNRRIPEFELRAAFENALSGAWRTYNPAKYDYIYHQNLVKNVLFRKGFFEAKVRTKRVQYLPEGIVITVGIKEGTRFRNGKAVIEGNTVFDRKEILKTLQWTPGGITDGVKIREGLFETLQQKYADLGYINYSPELVPAINKPSEPGTDGTVDLEIIINEGKQYRLSGMEIKGVNKEEQTVIRNCFKIKPGEIYSHKLVREGIEAVNKLEKYSYLDINQDLKLKIAGDDKEVFVALSVRRNQ